MLLKVETDFFDAVLYAGITSLRGQLATGFFSFLLILLLL